MATVIRRQTRYLQPVSSSAPSCWAFLAWLSLPSSLFYHRSRFLHPRLPPLQSHCPPHRCQSHLQQRHRGDSGGWGFPTHQTEERLTCWIIFGFGQLVVRLLAAKWDEDKTRVQVSFALILALVEVQSRWRPQGFGQDSPVILWVLWALEFGLMRGRVHLLWLTVAILLI